MSLDFYLSQKKVVAVFSDNITHNLVEMAKAAGIYMHLWRPHEIGITRAKELIAPLEEGLRKLKENPQEYSKYNSSNGWGMYENFVPFVERCLDACRKYPNAKITTSI